MRWTTDAQIMKPNYIFGTEFLDVMYKHREHLVIGVAQLVRDITNTFFLINIITKIDRFI